MGLSRRRTLQLAAAATFAPFGRPALADTYPSRVVRLFVGVPPGGGADLATRIVANGLSERWRQQVVVENRPGAGARIALDTVAHAPADGYAMLLAPGSPLVQPLLFSTLTFDPAADLAPVSLVGTYPNIIVVPNSLSARFGASRPALDGTRRSGPSRILIRVNSCGLLRPRRPLRHSRSRLGRKRSSLN
jgi:tripartite-type tricarboxylate transporter receptor subunit TctC